MSDTDPDPAASTAAFQAFAENTDGERARPKSALTVVLVVVAVLVAVGAIAYLMLG